MTTTRSRERKINEKCKCSIGRRKKEKEDVKEDQMMLLEQKKTIKMQAMKENNSCLRTFLFNKLFSRRSFLPDWNFLAVTFFSLLGFLISNQRLLF